MLWKTGMIKYLSQTLKRHFRKRPSRKEQENRKQLYEKIFETSWKRFLDFGVPF